MRAEDQDRGGILVYVLLFDLPDVLEKARSFDGDARSSLSPLMNLDADVWGLDWQRRFLDLCVVHFGWNFSSDRIPSGWIWTGGSGLLELRCAL